MKKLKQYISALVFTSFLGLALGFGLAPQDEYVNRYSLYMSLAAEPLPNESSSYELQRAAEHFSDMVLGWTVSPGFKLTDDTSFVGRRQEKQNLLFHVYSSDEEDASELLGLIDQHIQEYNESSKAQYRIALANITETDLETSARYFILGALVISFFAGLGLIFLYDSFLANRD